MTIFEDLKGKNIVRDDNLFNHYGVWINKTQPVTGVLSVHSIAWEWINDETCLTCEEIIAEIESDESMNDDEKQNEMEFIECNSDHTRLLGDWTKDSDGLYIPDETGEFAAIENESTVQVVWSKHTAKGAPCSPCYPGQIDLDSTGEFLAYTLPDELLQKDES